MSCRYLIKYGLKKDDRVQSCFIVCDTPSKAKTYAKIIAETYYDNCVEHGVLNENTLDYYTEQVRDEYAEKKMEYDEDAILNEAFSRYNSHRFDAIWVQWQEAY